MSGSGGGRSQPVTGQSSATWLMAVSNRASAAGSRTNRSPSSPVSAADELKEALSLLNGVQDGGLDYRAADPVHWIMTAWHSATMPRHVSIVRRLFLIS